MDEAELNSLEVEFTDKFNAKEYIKDYYPHIENVVELAQIPYSMHQNHEGNYHIEEIVNGSSLSHEVVENIAIFDFFRVVTEHFLEEYPRGNAQILDIGGGPTIYQHIGLSLVSEQITHSEFLDTNRQEVISWLQQDSSAHNWNSYFRLVQELFKQGEIARIVEKLASHEDTAISEHAKRVQQLLSDEDVTGFAEHIRERIGGNVVHGDIFQSGLGLKDETATFDIITSNFVVESASENVEQWEKGMKNVINHIKPGGYLVQTAIKNASWYQVGKEILPAFGVDNQSIGAICIQEGCRILYQKVLEGSNAEKVGYDGMIFTLAQKL